MRRSGRLAVIGSNGMRELAFLSEATVAALEPLANPAAGQQIEPREVNT